MDALPGSPEVPVEVDVGSIERELRTLWATTMPQTQGRAPQGHVVRACALNLVTILWQSTASVDDQKDSDSPTVRAGESQDLTSIQEVLAQVTRTHPARTIVVIAEPGGQPAGARSWISVRCVKPGGGALRVCHEEIRIALSGDAVQHLDNIVLSILVPDLPTFLWWNGHLPETPVEERAFGTLALHAERLVLDSLRLSNPYVELAAMTLFTHHEGPHATLGDLNYHRITGWRQIVAQAFDPPEMRPLLRRIRRVHVEYESPQRMAGVPFEEARVPPPIQVLLFIGWLASRLGWRADSPAQVSEALALFHQGTNGTQRDIVVTAGHNVREPDPRDESWLRRVDIDTDGGRVIVRRTSSGALECVTEGASASARSHTAPARPLDLGSVLSSELAILSRNEVYEQALVQAERLFTLALHEQRS